MTAFTEDEQWYSDLDCFAVDKNGRIGHFTSVGWRLLPPTIAKNKEDWQTVLDYFKSLPKQQNSYTICPKLQRHIDKKSIGSLTGYIKPSAEMSSRGLYAFDSYEDSYDERPYFRVTLPNNELSFENLPDKIKEILKRQKFDDVNFIEDTVISEERTNQL